MDVTLLLLIIALIVVIVLFAVTLRAGASTRRAAVANNGRQTADRPAIAARPQQTQNSGTQAVPDALSLEQSGAGGQETQRLLADTSGDDASPAQAQTFAPPLTSDVTTVVGQQAGAPVMSGTGETPALPDNAGALRPDAPPPQEPSIGDRQLGAADLSAASGDHVVAAGGARVGGDSVRYVADIPPATTVALDAPSREATEPATVATVATENADPVAAAPLSSDGAPADEGSVNSETALELAGPPATRTGAVMLSVTPQRLPYRLAELLGEQRGLEEAITIAHRRIDDIELGPDPGGADNRVRLAVLRQDLSQKQERLREILFLQDGYRWLQQHLAPERAPSES